ncbi:MOSC domain-containing protein [Intrasporangium calvum]|uniref:MOSC domain-containing protein n=1 Tax=Intrasporangium calvum TaxID=53358 RepID=A0ABT5GBS2_9MICO|nr:hypothetical protein [Intrasporangium calvum]MDC5695729.1 MOSC domain-containing protein [Intrasporangium calvum]
MPAKVSSLFIYPDSDEPAQELESVDMTPTGPKGNRSKKHAVHIVSAEEYVGTHPKANIVLDIETEALFSLVGSVIRLGDCTLTISKRPSHCPGVYAEVVEPGEVAVDDLLLAAERE